MALALVATSLPAAGALPTATPEARAIRKMEWRSIGPSLGGRVVAIAGVPSDPNRFYFGGVQGGIWRSTDYGNQWENISDGKLPRTAQTIGAIAVALSNSKVIYAGSGERDLRGDVDTGDGIYASTDAGTTWNYAGLRDTHTTTGLAIHPTDPKTVYAASMGHVFRSNPERGVYKTIDGGKTWKKILFVDDATGAIDLVMDAHNPNVLYAAMWQAQRVPWKLTSGGPGSGLYKTTDGGAHWVNIARNAGFAQGPLGRIGVAVAPSDPRVVYATVQAQNGGIFRSNDGGATWQHVNTQWKMRQRAFYYSAIFVDPKNANTAYAPEVDDVFKTTDGGKTWKPFFPPTVHGDHHILWINPNNTKIMLEGNDGGATVTTDGGKSWSSELNQLTGQFYHVALDSQFPFHVYGASQDEGAYEGPSATANGAIVWGDWHAVASGESTFVAPDPASKDVTFGGAYYSALFRQDNSIGQAHNVAPWARYLTGVPASAQKYRFGWTHPVLFSPANPDELFVTAQVVFSSTDRGKTWKVLSPDLTRNDKSTQGPSGGPIASDQTGAETFPDIASLAISPRNGDEIWAGSADGLVHVTTDHGAHWANVTPPQLPQWSQISSIEPSHTTAGTAYLTASRYMWDDFHPYVYVTRDFGKNWSPITRGLPTDEYAFVVRQDPREPRLLFAGLRGSVYASFDEGAHWESISLNLPGVQMRDIAIDARQGEVVVATHGRAFWILDNLALLEQVSRESASPSTAPRLFAPETAWLSHAYGVATDLPPAGGQNPPFGASVFFQIPADYAGKTPVTLTFKNAQGETVRRFDLHLKPKKKAKIAPEVRAEFKSIARRALALATATAIEPGMNRFQWDFRSAPATEVVGYREPVTDDFTASVDGPTVAPGTYTAVLTYGSTTTSKPVVVQLDPRLHAPVDELDARFALGMQIHDTLNALDTMLNAAIAMENHVSPAKRSQLDAAVRELVELDTESTEADTLHATKLRTHLAFLASGIDMAYEKPTAAEYAAFDELKAEADAGMARLKSLMGS